MQRRRTSSIMYQEGLESETIDDDDVFTAPQDKSVPSLEQHEFHTKACDRCKHILQKNFIEQELQRERYKRQREAAAASTAAAGGQSQLPGYSQDKFVQSPLVAVLNKDNYEKFMKQFDISLVFFYDPRNANSRRPAVEMRKAASATKRQGHAYGAVNCTVEKELCEKQNVSNIPFFRFFWKGGELSTVTTPHRLNSGNMQQLMENSKLEK